MSTNGSDPMTSKDRSLRVVDQLEGICPGVTRPGSAVVFEKAPIIDACGRKSAGVSAYPPLAEVAP